MSAWIPADAAAQSNSVVLLDRYASSLRVYKSAHAAGQVEIATLRAALAELRAQAGEHQGELEAWKQRVQDLNDDVRGRVLELATSNELLREAEMDCERLRAELRRFQEFRRTSTELFQSGGGRTLTQAQTEHPEGDPAIARLARVILGDHRYTIGIPPDFQCTCAASKALKGLYEARSQVYPTPRRRGPRKQPPQPTPRRDAQTIIVRPLRQLEVRPSLNERVNRMRENAGLLPPSPAH